MKKKPEEIEFNKICGLKCNTEAAVVAADSSCVFLAGKKGWQIFSLKNGSAATDFIPKAYINFFDVYANRRSFVFSGAKDPVFFVDFRNGNFPLQECHRMEGGPYEVKDTFEDCPQILTFIGEIDGYEAFIGTMYNYVLLKNAFVQGDVEWPREFRVQFVDEKKGRALVRPRTKSGFGYAICSYDGKRKKFSVDRLIPFKTSLKLKTVREDGKDWRYFNEEMLVFSEDYRYGNTLRIEAFAST